MILRIAGAIFVILHGIGHVQGLIAHLGFKTVEGHHYRSWLMTPYIGDGISRILGFILYIACLLIWIGAGLALAGWFIPHELWRPISITAAILSTIAILVYWNSMILPFNRIAALIVNIGALVCLLWLHWPSEADIGF